MTFGSFKVEVKRGPAPDSSKGQLGVAGAALAARRLVQAKEEERLQSSLREAEAAAARAGKDTAAHKQAISVVAKLNAQLRAHKLVAQSQLQLQEDPRKTTSDATEFHAIIPINDYPQKARWRVTNKETMVQLIDMTGASVTNKGIYYESGKEPPVEGPPKLHLLIESNEEWRVRLVLYFLILKRSLPWLLVSRSNRPSGKSNDSSSKLPLLRYKQRCGTRQLRQDDTVLFRTDYFIYYPRCALCFLLFHNSGLHNVLVLAEIATLGRDRNGTPRTLPNPVFSFLAAVS